MATPPSKGCFPLSARQDRAGNQGDSSGLGLRVVLSINLFPLFVELPFMSVDYFLY